MNFYQPLAYTLAKGFLLASRGAKTMLTTKGEGERRRPLSIITYFRSELYTVLLDKIV
jgi:hypothetical protein